MREQHTLPEDKSPGTSTLASGPAGTHFEARCGVVHASHARWCPCTWPSRCVNRSSSLYRPTRGMLDDVIIHGHDNISGKVAVLEVQVKRSITFAASDPVFRKVVGQIVKASQRPDFSTQRYELAIATTKGSRKIDGAYQDVLT